MGFVYRFNRWMFSVPDKERSVFEIILWWELRRIPYNLIVGVTAIFSLLLFYFFTSSTNAIEPGEDPVEPITLFAAPVVMNVCYTAGWVFEAFLNQGDSEDEEVGPKLLRSGLNLSLLIVTFPTVLWGGYWLLQVVGLIS